MQASCIILFLLLISVETNSYFSKSKIKNTLHAKSDEQRNCLTHRFPNPKQEERTNDKECLTGGNLNYFISLFLSVETTPYFIKPSRLKRLFMPVLNIMETVS